MDFLNSHKKLRQLVRERIDAGEFTVTELARKLAIGQGTLSNFLRGAEISNKLVERFLEVMRIDIASLFDLPSAMTIERPRFVPIVSHATAMFVPHITNNGVIRDSDFKIESVSSLPSFSKSERREWTRFVGIEVNRDQAAFLRPVFKEKAEIVIDRHYQRLDIFYAGYRALYAVREEGQLMLAYIDPYEDQLTLRPPLLDTLSRRILLRAGVESSQLIIGRVCKGTTDF